MIEMQYNFPLLASQGKQWQQRLRSAVEQLHPASADELRPTFRMTQTEHRATAAKWLGSQPETTWIVCGGHHGTLVSMLSAGLAGKTIAFDEISYTGGLEQARMLGCKVAAVAFDEEGMRADSLRAVCEREKISAIYTMPTVHNPLSCVASLARRNAIVEIAREFDLLIIQDDAYAYMEAGAPPSYAVLAPERTFYTRGLSKSYAPAMQTGFLIAPERYTAAIQTAVKNSTTGTSLVNNIAALSMVADGTVDAIIAEKLVEGERRNAAARALLGNAAFPGAVFPGARCAWLLWVLLPEGMSPQVAEAACAAKGVLVSGGNGFAAPGVIAKGLRIGLGGEVDFERMMQGVRGVSEVIKPFRS